MVRLAGAPLYMVAATNQEVFDMNKLTGFITAVLVLFAAAVPGVFADERPITVLYEGQEIAFDVQPAMINDTTMVPMRAIFETLGAKVEWDDETQTITAKRRGDTIVMQIGSNQMTVNDDAVTLDVSPQLVDERTLVPVRTVSESFKADVEWSEDEKTVSITKQTDEYDTDDWKQNTGIIDLDTMTVSGNGISVDGNQINITEGGDFEVSGTLADGMIYVNTPYKVKLRLSGASITNSNGPVIYFDKTKKSFITLTEGTVNTLTDSSVRTAENEDASAPLFSDDNLEIKGAGTLIVNGNYKHGVASDEDISIEEGTYIINSAAGDGIHAKYDCEISGGDITIKAYNDGIQAAEYDLLINNAVIDITSTAPIERDDGEQMGSGFGGIDPSEFEGLTQEETRALIEEKIANGEMTMPERAEISQPQATDETAAEDENISAKGLKAQYDLSIADSEISLNTTDHAVHSRGDIIIESGAVNIYSSCGKGISGHGDVTINGGTVNVEYSTEGIESKAILIINGGDINVKSTDDGLNAGGTGGAQMGGGMGGRPADMQGGMTPPDIAGETTTNGGQAGMTPPDMQNGTMPNGGQGGMIPPKMADGAPPSGDTFQNRENARPNMQGGFGGGIMHGGSDGHEIIINGGNLYIELLGNEDGIDSNGKLTVNGGCIVVHGSQSGANSALDSDGETLINGGEIIALGGSGMYEIPSQNSAQNVIVVNAPSTKVAGSVVSIKDASGNELLSFESVNGYQMLIYSSDKIQTGAAYTAYIDGEETGSAEVISSLTEIGTRQSENGGFRGGNGARNHNPQTTKAPIQ